MKKKSWNEIFARICHDCGKKLKISKSIYYIFNSWLARICNDCSENRMREITKFYAYFEEKRNKLPEDKKLSFTAYMMGATLYSVNHPEECEEIMKKYQEKEELDYFI